jgi:hypothetical protein
MTSIRLYYNLYKHTINQNCYLNCIWPRVTLQIINPHDIWGIISYGNLRVVWGREPRHFSTCFLSSKTSDSAESVSEWRSCSVIGGCEICDPPREQQLAPRFLTIPCPCGAATLIHGPHMGSVASEGENWTWPSPTWLHVIHAQPSDRQVGLGSYRAGDGPTGGRRRLLVAALMLRHSRKIVSC